MVEATMDYLKGFFLTLSLRLGKKKKDGLLFNFKEGMGSLSLFLFLALAISVLKAAVDLTFLFYNR
jgi:hypothetical protein